MSILNKSQKYDVEARTSGRTARYAPAIGPTAPLVTTILYIPLYHVKMEPHVL